MQERTVIHTLITIDGASFVLAPTQDADQLCEELESAAAGTGTVVRFEAAGHRIVRDREFREWATEVGGRTSRCRQVR